VIIGFEYPWSFGRCFPVLSDYLFSLECSCRFRRVRTGVSMIRFRPSWRVVVFGLRLDAVATNQITSVSLNVILDL